MNSRSTSPAREECAPLSTRNFSRLSTNLGPQLQGPTPSTHGLVTSRSVLIQKKFKLSSASSTDHLSSLAAYT
ncbi:hypothetical protein PGT21_006212 [Puccinia graminis f. sp. tritici]|uniref:Uncharacterized protein n=1 Tax=Puccinia graminis f. sp. tritici TaxID=56615 RepID=A0A5B0QAJ7_PUCGR|nr:hypothetical protein PGT21_006212 [Puccinia graminis f. sp. tritici]